MNVKEKLNAIFYFEITEDEMHKRLTKRNERDEINKQVHENKELRNECNEELKKVEWNSGKKEISKSLTKLKTSMVEILNINSDLDESIKDIDMESITFTNINKVIYDRSKNKG